MDYPFYDNVDEPWDTGQKDGKALARKPEEEAGSWSLAGQILEMLGEECQVDSSFFENSWTYGLSATVQEHRYGLEHDETQSSRNGGFAELDEIGAWCWVQARAGVEEPLQPPCAIAAAKSYQAEMFEGFSVATNERATERAKSGKPVASDDAADEMEMIHPMTLERACELLHLSVVSSEAQIKAAYRRLVSRWHPDLYESGNELERARATKQMTAINDAYRVLRSVRKSV